MRKKSCVMFGIGLFVFCAQGLPQNAEPSQAKGAGTAKRERIVAPQSQAVYVDIIVPPAISKTQLEHYRDILELSDAQAIQFDALYKQYLATDGEMRKAEIGPLWESSARIAGEQFSENRGPSISYAEDFTELMRQRDAAVGLILEGENSFFDAMKEYLAESQLPALDRVKKLRERQRSRELPGGFPGCNFDLSEEVFRLKRLGFDTQPLDALKFRADLLEYERAATKLFIRAYELRYSAMIEATVLQAREREIVDTETDQSKRMELLVPVREQRLRINEQAARANRAIYELNRRNVEIVAENLSRDTAEVFRFGFKTSTFKMVYPDPFDCEEVLDDAIKLESLADDQRDLIDVMKSDFLARRDALSRSMEKEYLDWWFHVEVHNGHQFAAYHEYQDHMLTLQLQRKQNAEKALAALSSVLTTEQVAKLDAPLARYRAGVEKFDKTRERLASYSGEWPPPYNHVR